MPEELLSVVGLLSLGYVLMLIEIFVPGGVLGVMGLLSVAYGCVLAFDLGTSWGFASVAISVVFTAVALRVFLRSRTARKLVHDLPEVKDWKANAEGLSELVGRSGRVLTPLRPSGLAEIGEARIDVVSDSEFLEAGVRVRVCEVEGNRVVVEADEAPLDEALPDEAPPDETPPDETPPDEAPPDEM